MKTGSYIIILFLFFILIPPVFTHERNTAANHEIVEVEGVTLVLDKKYNLLWERKGEKGRSLLTGDKLCTWKEALEYAEYLNEIKYAGRTDWRIPSSYEFATIVDAGVGTPSIDTNAFPNTGNKHFWTRSEYPPIPTVVQYTNFIKGNQFKWMKTGKMRVRCVTGGGFLEADHKTPGNYSIDEFTVTDHVTGLTWEKKAQQGDVPMGEGPIGQEIDALKSLITELPDMAREILYEEFYVSGHYINNVFTLANFMTLPQFLKEFGIDLVVDLYYTYLRETKGIDWDLSLLGPRSMFMVRSFDEALDYIDWLNEINYGGYNDWRLPEQMELITTVDWDELPTVKEAFLPAFIWIYWTNTSDHTGKRHYFT